MMDMKRLLISVLLLALLLTLAGCGVRQEPLETWPIVYNYNTISCYTRDYETIGDMLEEVLTLRGDDIPDKPDKILDLFLTP